MKTGYSQIYMAAMTGNSRVQCPGYVYVKFKVCGPVSFPNNNHMGQG